MSVGHMRRIWWAIGLLLCAVFIYGCLMHNPPSAPGIPDFDKFEHGSAFLVMGAWFGVLYLRLPGRVLIALSLFAAGTEVMQWASGYRDGDPLDWVADTFGILIGLSVAWLAWQRFGPQLERLLGDNVQRL